MIPLCSKESLFYINILILCSLTIGDGCNIDVKWIIRKEKNLLRNASLQRLLTFKALLLLMNP